MLTPRFVPGLSFTADYYSIDVKGTITAVSPAITFNNCLTLDQNCNLVVRRPDSGGIFASTTLASGGYIVGINSNEGFLKTTGIDFSLNYRFDLDRLGLKNLGGVAFNYNATYMISFQDQPIPGGSTYDCAGLYGPTCGFEPSYKHNFRVTYNSPWNIGVSAAWRFIAPMSYEVNSGQPLISGAFDAYNAHVGAISYFDLTATYKVRTGLSGADRRQQHFRQGSAYSDRVSYRFLWKSQHQPRCLRRAGKTNLRWTHRRLLTSAPRSDRGAAVVSIAAL